MCRECWVGKYFSEDFGKVRYGLITLLRIYTEYFGGKGVYEVDAGTRSETKAGTGKYIHSLPNMALARTSADRRRRLACGNLPDSFCKFLSFMPTSP